jgi:hypothetical protein
VDLASGCSENQFDDASVALRLHLGGNLVGGAPQAHMVEQLGQRPDRYLIERELAHDSRERFERSAAGNLMYRRSGTARCRSSWIHTV